MRSPPPIPSIIPFPFPLSLSVSLSLSTHTHATHMRALLFRGGRAAARPTPRLATVPEVEVRKDEEKRERRRGGEGGGSGAEVQLRPALNTQPNPAFDAAWPAAPDGDEAAGPAWEAVEPSLVWSCVGSGAATSAPASLLFPPPQSVFAFPAAAEARPPPPAKPLVEDAVPAPIALAEYSAPSLGLLPALVRPASFSLFLCAVRSLSAPLSPPPPVE